MIREIRFGSGRKSNFMVEIRSELPVALSNDNWSRVPINSKVGGRFHRQIVTSYIERGNSSIKGNFAASSLVPVAMEHLVQKRWDDDDSINCGFTLQTDATVNAD